MESLNRERYRNPNSFGYAPPIVNKRPMGNNNSVLKNQTSPLMNTVAIDPKIFKLNPVTLQCPFCHRTVTTDVETSCSCRAFCFWWFTGWFPYFCIQCCRGKGLRCEDAVHYCPCCDGQIGTYSAC